MTGETLVVVGLGNPGPGYAGNRHNVGQMVLDELASRMGATFKKHKTPNQVAEGRLVPGGTRLVLAKPASFMNTSGGPVSSVLGFYSATPADLVVVHDELDLPFDTVRLKGSGGHGGHNGLRDIIKATGTNEFTRVRVGIGRPPGRQDPADYVLRDFAAAEKKTLPILLADAADAVEAIAEVGLLAAQQRVHAPS
ncbi:MULTISPECIES: aminoacyl-tRNA hydrolase [unclassified Curtobacterium]|uniref:aminoacyl-tRNA hydrolase n=1 Tax=unclassified Curtobacterium TaxID=257496 RepID=UPI0008DDD338|nr:MULTISPECIES: aminoacyl-tRNA hydrolase [unclassified Curtobacterium]OIH94050.1 aminoacyl-tRNA hydrolase [Curtobacterium sp. MCBA15_003]OII15986.1 aminoacyl-tRNA hydrolase [Curtobacterium sp. MCBA15_009]OII33490.1 aminoacyl-tRNA hydrolase [Curtobacterium sp. MMLR14_006]WIE65723.1 aminoacyl-tRNA hydrolase [Curtobacterium sp. MCLR17_036]